MISCILDMLLFSHIVVTHHLQVHLCYLKRSIFESVNDAVAGITMLSKEPVPMSFVVVGVFQAFLDEYIYIFNVTSDSMFL